MEDFLKGIGKLIGGVCIMGLLAGIIGEIAYGGDSSEDSSNSYYDDDSYSSNVNFKGSYNDKYKGKPCKHKDIGDVQTCGERGDCYGGFDSQDWDASICINCGHSYKDHR